ncbi:glycosyl transferase [Tritrichomonas foetus]|uniref:dolichyl-phosphate beta-glucosyltransferase n=1 Tax=Tritrichomonas foetus TaxID=1144522 RepID=A0A1J4K4P3_9EUKA|nr:glycosyl transferase [Tritrichomonas foetus]|eukprot:OHT06417.1 glycosyl transferase [Tritrichomonas foetus]
MWFTVENDPEFVTNLMNIVLLILVFISFIFVLYDQFYFDETLYDLENLPTTNPRKITYYIEPMVNTQHPEEFPSIFKQPTVTLTVVIPAYNESLRLPDMLKDTIDYLRNRQQNDSGFTFEIIVVDDGSKDNTADLTIKFANSNPEVRLLRQPFNMGKGAAVQAGCLHARGKMMLMVDADGATKISELALLESKYFDLYRNNQRVVVVGSRALLDGQMKADRTFVRKLLGKAFHILIYISGVRGIKDTQCGFKLFSREAARWLFPNQRIQRWCFDPELLVIARKKDMAVAEIPVEWHEIPGSKMRISAMFKMAMDLLKIAVFYGLGLWDIRMKESDSFVRDADLLIM